MYVHVIYKPEFYPWVEITDPSNWPKNLMACCGILVPKVWPRIREPRISALHRTRHEMLDQVHYRSQMLHGAGIFTYIDLHGWVICSGVGKYHHGAYGEWDHSIQNNSGITMNDNNHWLVASNIFLFSISYMGCHPNPIDELIFFKMVIAPPTRSCIPVGDCDWVTYTYTYSRIYGMFFFMM